jgi:Holliday junction resolvasome RuvABC endonuclease subunit
VDSESITIVGFDPGVSTGFAVISVTERKIKPLGLGVLGKSLDDIEMLQEAQRLIKGADHVVIENFKLRPDVAEAGRLNQNDMPASQVIGKLKTLCGLAGVKYHLQMPSVKPVAYGLANLTYQKGRQGTHSQDAMAHAVYYAVQKLHALPVGANVP